MNKNKESGDNEYTYITPRTLLGIVRLSQAFAKLRFSNEVGKKDIENAIELIEKAQSSVLNENQ